MLQSQKETTESLQSAITLALANDISAERIHSMVTALEQTLRSATLKDVATALLESLDAADDDPTPTAPGELPIYDTLPDGLIDLPSAARKYGVKLSTIRSWVRRGHLDQAGLLKAPARGGGYIVVDEAAFLRYMNSPRNRGGRPRSRESRNEE